MKESYLLLVEPRVLPEGGYSSGVEPLNAEDIFNGREKREKCGRVIEVWSPGTSKTSREPVFM